MEREKVRGLIEAYRANVGRRCHLQAEVKRLGYEYEMARREMMLTLAGPRAQVISDMPKGGGAPGSVVENAVLKALSGYENERMREIREERKAVGAELDRLNVECAYVEAWAEGLPGRERFVFECKCMNGELWRDVFDEYQERYGVMVSAATLKRLKNRALKRIYSMAVDVV